MEPLAAEMPEALLGIVATQAWSHRVAGDLRQALATEKKLRDLIGQAEDSPHLSIAKFSLSLFNRWRGDFKECSDFLAAVLPQLREDANAEMYLANVFTHGLALGEQGRYQDAIENMEEGLNFGVRTGERYSTPKITNTLGWVFHELCLIETALDYNSRALNLIMELMGPGTTNLFEIESQTRINLGENYLMKGELKRSLEHLNLVYRNSKKPAYFFVRARWKPRCLLALGEWHLLDGNPAKAQRFLSEVREQEWVDKFPFKKYQVRGGRLQGNIFASQGKYKEAEAELKRALRRAGALGNPPQLWRTLQALGNLYRQQEKSRQALTQYRKALKIVRGMADGLTDPELREGFLASGPIREVFALARE
ncbi:MAG: tetratricopeptide repeat protein [bacterium]